MTIEFPSIKSSLSGKKLLLATNHTRSTTMQKHLLIAYPPDTLMLYQQAGWLLGAKVIQLTFDDMIKTLSQIDSKESFALAINLIAGLNRIALEGVLPSLASLHKIEVFPAGILSQIISEDKLMSKKIAITCGLRCPETFSEKDIKSVDKPIMVKPIIGTDSVGIQKHAHASKIAGIDRGYYAETFIEGKDVTIHVWWDESYGSYRVLDCFGTNLKETEWFDRGAKRNANLIYNRPINSNRPHIPLSSLSKELIESINRFLNLIGQPFVARLDFRCVSGLIDLNIDNMYFLEVNSTPTISNSNNWWSGILGADLNIETQHFIEQLDGMPVHPAAKSIAFFMDAFYVQSLSMHNDSLCFSENTPKTPGIL